MNNSKLNGRMRATRRLPAAFLLGLIVLSGAVLIFHDYICHEHGGDLHEICGPLHTSFVSAEPFAAEVAFGGCQPRALQSLTAQGFPLSGFTANIFHPPDLSA